MIIGAQKAGTTALNYFLAQHPAIVMASGKEVHLFDSPDYSPEAAAEEINRLYAPHFEEATLESLWAEATPIYLYLPYIVPALKRYNPRLKLIVLLRDPVERALSQYAMEKGRGSEHLPLWLALLLEPLRLWLARHDLTPASSLRCHSYIDRGKYAEQLLRLFEHFSADQILLIESAQLKQDHHQVLDMVYRFLGVANGVEIEPEQIFAGDYSRVKEGFGRALIKKCLAARFYFANRRLKKTLLQLGYSPNWPWLR